MVLEGQFILGEIQYDDSNGMLEQAYWAGKDTLYVVNDQYKISISERIQTKVQSTDVPLGNLVLDRR